MKTVSKEDHNYETLGENVIPLRYVLNFRPDLKKFAYEATEVIEVKVVKSDKRDIA